MQTTQRVVPTRGAIVRTNYAGNIGLRAFIHLKTPSGREVPFGAMVTLSGAAKSQASIVSDAGMVYMTGLQPTGVLTVSWGKKQASNVPPYIPCPPARRKIPESVRLKPCVDNHHNEMSEMKK